MLPAKRQLSVVVAGLLATAALVALSGCAGGKASGVTLVGGEDLAASTTEPSATGADDADTLAAQDPVAPTESEATTDTPGSASMGEQPGGVPGGASDEDVPRSVQNGAMPGQTSAADAFDEIDAALAAQDLCALYAGLEHIQIQAADPAELTDQLDRISEAMLDAESIADPALLDDWRTVTAGTRALAKALAAHPDDFEAAASVYDDAELRAAQERVDEWMEQRCG